MRIARAVAIRPTRFNLCPDMFPEVTMRTIVAAIAALTIAPACQPSEEDAVEAKDSCGAAGYQSAVGTPHEAHDFTDPDRPVRIIPPNSAVTMDHRPDRLNIDIDEDGVITRIWCG